MSMIECVSYDSPVIAHVTVLAPPEESVCPLREFRWCRNESVCPLRDVALRDVGAWVLRERRRFQYYVDIKSRGEKCIRVV
jgi:hypothetical protein